MEEDEEKLVVDVMRLGSMKGTVKVRYYTDAWIEAQNDAGEKKLSSPGTR